MAGDVAIYIADSLNVHSVDEIIEGERITLTSWFSRDSTHDEDSKLISLLSENMLHCSDNVPQLKLPMLASSSMYWFSPEQVSNQDLGFDLCCARLHVRGFDIYSYQRPSSSSEPLMDKVQLARGNELYVLEFANVLHVVQVVEFYCWKALDWLNCCIEVDTGKVIQLSESEKEKISALKTLVLKDHQLAESVFGGINRSNNRIDSFDWEKFSCAVVAWEDYTMKLHRELLLSLPFWKNNILYTVFLLKGFDDKF